MLCLLSCLSLAATVAAGVVHGPSGKAISSQEDNGHSTLKQRGVFSPISTSSPFGLAGGQIACDAAPVSSFFAGLQPPVC